LQDEIEHDEEEKGEMKKLKRDKRKEKKSKKEQSEIKCNVCKEAFDTRNALFTHIKKTGHARAM